MSFLKLKWSDFSKGYEYQDASNVKMNILGNFLSKTLQSKAGERPCHCLLYKEWAFSDKSKSQRKSLWSVMDNIMAEEEDDGCIYLSLSLPLEEDEELIRLKMTKEQFVKILDDWESKVCKLKPQHVTIKHIDEQFIFETSD